MKIQLLTARNKYGYTTKQLRIDWEKKEYQVGNLAIGGEKATCKQIDEMIENLKAADFKEVK